MENELQRKIEWLEKRHEETHLMVERIEQDRRLDRSTKAQTLLRQAKKEKLRLKDHIAWKFSPENFTNQLQGATGYVGGVGVNAGEVFGVNEGQVSSLFGPVSQTAVGDEAEADFGLFTFDPVQ